MSELSDRNKKKIAYRRIKHLFQDIVSDIVTDDQEFADVRQAIYARGKGIFTALSTVPNDTLRERLATFDRLITTGVSSEIFMCWLPYPASRQYVIFYSYCDAEMLHTMAIHHRDYI